MFLCFISSSHCDVGRETHINKKNKWVNRFFSSPPCRVLGMEDLEVRRRSGSRTVLESGRSTRHRTPRRESMLCFSFFCATRRGKPIQPPSQPTIQPTSSGPASCLPRHANVERFAYHAHNGAPHPLPGFSPFKTQVNPSFSPINEFTDDIHQHNKISRSTAPWVDVWNKREGGGPKRGPSCYFPIP